MGYTVVKGGLLWQKDHFVRNEEYCLQTDGPDSQLVLGEEDLITPGIIDFHLHLWSPATRTPFGVPAEQMFAQGVIGGLDAGSFGADNWDVADRFWSNAGPLKVKSFASILPEGLAVFPPVDPPRPENLDVEDMIRKINEKKNENFLGIKIQLGWLSYKDEETDREMIRQARYMADRTGTRIMVHISGTYMQMDELMSFFRKGDIITHLYSGFKNTILQEDGTVHPAVWEAAKRGVLLDVGHAGKHFSWEVFRKAYAQGLGFDTLGGDITINSWKNMEKFRIYDQLHLIAGMENAGVPRDEVFRAVITNPAEYLGIGTDLKDHCLILRKVPGNRPLGDGQGQEVICRFEYEPAVFVNNHKVIYKKEEK